MATSYDGKRVLITGAHSGMGAATVALLDEAGAEIHALDIEPVSGRVASFQKTDVGDPEAVDDALARIGSPIHGLFNCAGIPQTFSPLDVMRVNFLGLRHLTEAALPLMPDGAAVAHVSSVAGAGWARNLASIKSLLATPDFASGLAWCSEHAELVGDGYFFSKECVTVYTMVRRRTAVRAGVRMNCIAPGPVDTPMMPHFRKVMGDAIDWTVQAVGRMGTPEEMAPPLLFLNSDAASYVNGHTLIVDAGLSAQLATGSVGGPEV